VVRDVVRAVAVAGKAAVAGVDSQAWRRR